MALSKAFGTLPGHVLHHGIMWLGSWSLAPRRQCWRHLSFSPLLWVMSVSSAAGPLCLFAWSSGFGLHLPLHGLNTVVSVALSSQG